MKKGSELRRLRLRTGLSQAAFGRKLDLHRNAVSNYETGKRDVPLVVTIAARCLVEHQGLGR